MIKWNIPNGLTVLRFILIPVFLVVYLTANAPAEFYIAAGILLFSGVTDILDGMIARRYHMETEWGRAFDPIADKATQIAVAYALWRVHPGLWFAPCFFIVKEGIMLLCGIRLYRRFHQVWGAQWFGKLATVVFYLVTLFVVAMGTQMHPLAVEWMMVAVVGVMLFAALQYVATYLRIVSDRQTAEKQNGKEQMEEK